MNKWTEFAIRIQSLAQAGLAYCENEYDIERYEELRKIAAEKLIAVQDWRKHNRCNLPYGVIKIFVLCNVLGGSFEDNIETTEIKYFGKKELPENLAVEKTTEEQIQLCFEAYESEHWESVLE